MVILLTIMVLKGKLLKCKTELTTVKDKNEVTCYFGFIGTGKIQSYRLCLSQVLEKMSNFIDKVLGMAVKEGYISGVDVSFDSTATLPMDVISVDPPVIHPITPNFVTNELGSSARII